MIAVSTAACFNVLLLQGVKIKMDEAGNILIRRYSKCNVFIKSTATNLGEETSTGSDILKLPNNCLENDKIFKVSEIAISEKNSIFDQIINQSNNSNYPTAIRYEEISK